MKIFTRGNKIWVTLSQYGKRIRKSTGLADTKANRKQVEKELFPIIEKTNFGKNDTVGYYYNKMMSIKKLKYRSAITYDGIYHRHIMKFANYPITDIDIKFAREWTASLTISARTIRSVINIFNQIINEAIYDCVIEANPFTKVRLPKLEKYEPNPYSDKEVKIILNTAKGWFKNFIAFMFLTGMRTGEVCALEWSDIKDGYISVTKSRFNDVVDTTKTGTTRQVPIFNNLLPFIENQRKLTGNKKFVFPEAWGAQHIRSRWKKLTDKCNMQGRVLYNARHTFAIKALDSGKFKVSQISKMLGHSSPQMLFQKYAKYIKSENQEIDLNFSTF